MVGFLRYKKVGEVVQLLLCYQFVSLFICYKIYKSNNTGFDTAKDKNYEATIDAFQTIPPSVFLFTCSRRAAIAYRGDKRFSPSQGVLIGLGPVKMNKSYTVNRKSRYNISLRSTRT